MIDILFEQRVIQNTGLGAEAIWQAMDEAYRLKGRAEGVPLPLAFLVLPLTFHRRTANSLSSKTKPGALYKAIASDREILVGLQSRMQSMADRTFDALSIGFHSGLLQIDRGHQYQLIPTKRNPPITHVTSEVKVILGAAKRVGQAFAEMSIEQISSHLNIRF